MWTLFLLSVQLAKLSYLALISSPPLEPSLLGLSECRLQYIWLELGGSKAVIEWTKRYLVLAAFSGMWHLPCPDQSWLPLFRLLLTLLPLLSSLPASGTDTPPPFRCPGMFLLTHLILFCLKISDVLVLNLVYLMQRYNSYTIFYLWYEFQSVLLPWNFCVNRGSMASIGLCL